MHSAVTHAYSQIQHQAALREGQILTDAARDKSSEITTIETLQRSLAAESEARATEKVKLADALKVAELLAKQRDEPASQLAHPEPADIRKPRFITYAPQAVDGENVPAGSGSSNQGKEPAPPGPNNSEESPRGDLGGNAEEGGAGGNDRGNEEG